MEAWPSKLEFDMGDIHGFANSGPLGKVEVTSHNDDPPDTLIGNLKMEQES